MRAILTAFCLVWATGVIAESEDKPLSVSLERTVCFGTCPSYVVTILADGHVTFEGRQYVIREGVFKKKIDPSKLIPIFEKIEEIHFWELKDQYRFKENPDGSITRVTDLPTKYVTVKTSARSKKVEDYYGAPKGLAELEKLIDEVAGVSEWVGN